MKNEFEEKLKELLKEYNASIIGRDISMIYNTENDLLELDGLMILIESKGL